MVSRLRYLNPNDDADGTLVDAINAVTDSTGVVATIDEDNHLLLTAEDGRNIEVVNVGALVGCCRYLNYSRWSGTTS